MVMKRVSLLLILIFAVIAASAQDTAGTSAQAGRKTTFERNGFWDNWFVGAGYGANIMFGDRDARADLQSRLNLIIPNVQVGKWVSPVWGGRLKVDGGRVHNFAAQGRHMLKSNYVHGQVDLMFNMTNYFCKYNDKRLYNFIPYVGIGFAYGWDHKNYAIVGLADNKSRSATINAGIINNFRLSNRVDLQLELTSALLKDDWDKRTGNEFSYDGMAGASVNFVYKLGNKTNFNEAVLLDQGLIDDLNDQINKLRQENARLALRPESCPECPKVQAPVVQSKAAPVSNVVFFRLNSANIDKGQEVSIYNTAKYLQDNPNAKVQVVGYADKKTGTASINDKLSEKRAKNVANALINKYNISSSRVDVQWKGDTVQPYAQNEWNRVAIFIVEQ